MHAVFVSVGFYALVTVALAAFGVIGIHAGAFTFGRRRVSAGLRPIVGAYTGIAGACLTAALCAARAPTHLVLGGLAIAAAAFGFFIGRLDAKPSDGARRSTRKAKRAVPADEAPSGIKAD